METTGNKKIILTNKLEIDIIELPKIKGNEENQDELLDWLYFLIEPKGERVTRKMEENEELKEAVKKLERLSVDERMQRIADLRQKARLDEKAIYRKGLQVGARNIAKELLMENIPIEKIMKITGLTEEEMEEMDEPTKEEIEQRIAKQKEEAELEIANAKKEEKKKIARELLNEDMPIEKILKITGLTKEEIQKMLLNNFANDYLQKS